MSSSLRRLRFCPVCASAVVLLAAVAFATLGEGSWSKRTNMSHPRDLARAVNVDGQLYVVGGHDSHQDLGTLEVYDPITDNWTRKAPMPTPRHQSAVGAIKGIIYVAGGCCPASTTLEAYDTIHDKWTKKVPMPIASEPVGAVVGETFYAIGGNASGYCTNKIQAYNPNLDKWTLVADMPTPRCHLAAAVLDGMLYVFGGSNTSGDREYNVVEIYNPKSGRWRTGPPMPTPRSLLAAAALGSKIYVLGGNTISPDKRLTGTLSTVEIYAPSDRPPWTRGKDMLTRRSGLAVGVVRHTLYAIGGNGNHILATNEAFTFTRNSSSKQTP